MRSKMQAVIERFEGTAVITDARPVASRDDARAALDMLDGRQVSSVSFEPAEGPTLMISGGPGAYLASTWDEAEGEGWTAVEPGDGTPGEVEIVSAGQSVAVPAAQVLSRARLDALVAQFLDDQSRTPELDWVAG